MIAYLLVQLIIAARRRERALRGVDAAACRLPVRRRPSHSLRLASDRWWGTAPWGWA